MGNYNKSLIIQRSSILLLLVALCALIGFMIVYRITVTSNRRPVIYYGIVIDAGSTETRSSLYKLTANLPLRNENKSLVLVKEKLWSGNGGEIDSGLPAAEVLSIEQISSCINGGPVAAINSTLEASGLVKNCIVKFTKLIEQNHPSPVEEIDDNVISSRITGGYVEDDGIDTKSETSLNYKGNSISETHLYLGATAGMRSIQAINPTKASSIITMVNDSLDKLGLSNFINKDYIDIISGPDEALYAWLSVNYICKKLPFVIDSSNLEQPYQSAATLIHTAGDSAIDTVGTLELGGASAQMAYEVLRPKGKPVSEDVDQEDEFNQHIFKRRLFNRPYQIKTRCDMCLGMSQAVLRTNIILIDEYYRTKTAPNTKGNATAEIIEEDNQTNTVTLVHPCLQNNSFTPFTNISKLLSAPCTISSWAKKQNRSTISREDEIKYKTYQEFADYVGKKNFVFKGLADMNKCVSLLDRLIQSEECQKYFALCPKQVPNLHPPANMPFVTISGYNKAVDVLSLSPSKEMHPEIGSSKIEIKDVELQRRSRVIQAELGGYSVDHADYIRETYKLCHTDIQELPTAYPKLKKPFYNILCLELVYIERLVTKYYLFDPNSSWLQVKFLVFSPSLSPSPPKFIYGNKNDQAQMASDPAPTTSLTPVLKQNSSSVKNEADLGWTLGLLLNATNYGYIDMSGSQTNSKVHYRHGTPLTRILRNSIFLIFACCLFAFSILFFTLIIMHSKRQSGSHYIHSESYP